MGFVAFLLFGLVVGLIARAVMPGAQPMGLIRTTLLGIGGSFVGGTLASALSHKPYLVIHPAGLIGSIVGAMVLLLIAAFLRR